MLHGLTTAESLALGWRAHVDILSPAQGHLDYARAITSAQSHCLLRFELIGSRLLRRLSAVTGSVIPPKLLTLLNIRERLDSYDALVLPERTSSIIRKLGVTRPALIHCDHGAGDRAAGFDPRIARFDFALVAGEKQRRRMLAEGLIRPGAHATVGYPKFEAADRVRDQDWTPFAERRPIILYNPHFSRTLGSWDKAGVELVARIAQSGRYNLIVAPHVRLCDNARRRAAVGHALAPFRDLPNVHVDLGSDRCIDMTYTMMADIYLGDVSSQIYEFLRTPRPCLFFNAHGRAWRDDPDFAHWRYGPVIADAARITEAIDDARAQHGDFVDTQRQGFSDTFDLKENRSHSLRAAEAIAVFMSLPEQRDWKSAYP